MTKKENKKKLDLSTPYLIAQTAMVTLKLAGDVDWSWWTVLLPSFVYWGFSLLVLGTMGIVLIIVLHKAPKERLQEVKGEGGFDRFFDGVKRAIDGEDEE